MRLAALALLILAGVGAWQLRENGILLGRDADGPLMILPTGTASVALKTGQVGDRVDIVRADGEVEVERVRPRLVSPGLELLGPVVYEKLVSPRLTARRGWPPPRSRALDGESISGERSVGFGLRAAEPGFYHLAGMRYRYRRGMRGFDEADGTAMCVHVSDGRLRNGCPAARPVTRFEGLAEVGGPSNYAGGRFLDDDEGFGDEGVVFRARRGGRLEFVITISNLAGEDLEVPRLDLVKPGLDPLPSDPPAPFTIPAGGSRKVRVRARYADCDWVDEERATTFTAIEAGKDDVELGMPVTVARVCR